METEELRSRRERIIVEPPNSGGNKLWIWILIILIVAAIGAGAWFFFGRSTSGTADSDLTPTESPTEAPTPTEEEADLTAFEVQVLNGSGVAGEAGRLQKALEDAGFTVSGTGNADNSDYTETIIQAKADVDEAFLKALAKELSKTYTVGDNEELDEDDENNVVVIIGGVEDSEDEEASDEADTEDEEDATPTPTKAEEQ